ncbi:MAG: hypothetical protein MPK03_01310 [Alphaproteobacteria bacterium]|nr:hypothetical protein [Alphaproteobacteria bacterium]
MDKKDNTFIVVNEDKDNDNDNDDTVIVHVKDNKRDTVIVVNEDNNEDKGDTVIVHVKDNKRDTFIVVTFLIFLSAAPTGISGHRSLEPTP